MSDSIYRILTLLVFLAGIASPIFSKESSAKLAFVGDVNFTGRIGEFMEKNGTSWAFEKVKANLEGSDFTIANLESPAGVGGYKYCDKRVYFKANPKNLDALVHAGIDLVSLANNHALDYGPDILKQTQVALEERGILYAGIVSNKYEVNKPVIVNINDIKVAFLSYCNACPAEFGPRSNTAGVSVGLGQWIKKQVKSVKEQGVDFVVAMPHWGSEYFAVDKNQMYTARMMREAGVDLIVGHHTHVLQKVELIDKTLVAWSLGNFLFPMRWQISLDSAILTVKLEKGKAPGWTYVPISLDTNRPVPVEDTKTSERIDYILKNGYEYNNVRNWPSKGPWEVK